MALARRRGEVEIACYFHQMEVDRLAAIDEMDTAATADALEFALHEEFRIVDQARAQAQGDPVKTELVARKLEFFAAANNARARRRFGRLG